MSAVSTMVVVIIIADGVRYDVCRPIRTERVGREGRLRMCARYVGCPFGVTCAAVPVNGKLNIAGSKSRTNGPLEANRHRPSDRFAGRACPADPYPQRRPVDAGRFFEHGASGAWRTPGLRDCDLRAIAELERITGLRPDALIATDI